MPVKSVPIVLNDGKTRHLRFEWEALNKLEKELSTSIFELGTSIISGKLGFNMLSTIISVGIQSDEEKLEHDEVVKLLDSSEFVSYTKAVGDAFNSIFPKEEREKKEAGPNRIKS